MPTGIVPLYTGMYLTYQEVLVSLPAFSLYSLGISVHHERF